MSRVPRIRFKGFEEDWEQRKHGEVFIYLRNNTLSREELNDEDGFAQSIHYGDVLIKYGECLNVSKELLPYIDNKNIVNKFKKFYIQNGDVIIADTAEDETVGKCIEISGIVDHNIISGLHTIPLRPVNKFAYGYLGFYLNSNSYHNQLKPLMQGIKVTSISKNLLKTTTLNYPSNIQEQKIIGRYFDALNHLITLHQRKLEKLKIIKKSMLENLFPQNGEKTPKIRFSGFTKDWEQRKLGEVIQERNIRTSDFDKFPIFSLTIESGVTPKTERYERSSLVTKTEDLFKVVKPNEFVTNPMNLRFGALGYNTQKYDISVSGYYDVFSIDGNNCSGFWNAYFKTQQVMNIFDNVATGSLVEKKRVKYSTLKQIYVSVPSAIEEKNKISKFMRFTDHLITLHQSKLEKLQKIKKSMLESMFV